jgi:hypothetical protein
LRYVELALAAALSAGGVRALVRSLRERFVARDLVDHLLYAMYVTGRVGVWFGLAGLFVIVASIRYEGRALIDEFRGYRWYFMVPIALGALQFVGGQLLARRSPR